jgi:WD40 repeat protein
VRVTSNNADNPVSDIALSPNGKYLAYSHVSGVHVRDMQTGESRLIPDTKGLSVWWWNTDSTEIFGARQANPHNVAYRISLLGGVPHMLGNNLPSPGGKYAIAFDKNQNSVRRLSDGREFPLAREGVYRPWSVWAPNERILAAHYHKSTAEGWIETLDLGHLDKAYAL